MIHAGKTRIVYAFSRTVQSGCIFKVWNAAIIHKNFNYFVNFIGNHKIGVPVFGFLGKLTGMYIFIYFIFDRKI